MTEPASSHQSLNPPSETRLILDDIEASPSPFHATTRAAELLSEAGYRAVEADRELPSEPGPYLVRIGGLLIAWVLAPNHRGFTVVGAHTDSPNLRVKPKPVKYSADYRQLAVEIYGGVLLNSWLDRDLGLAGRVAVSTDDGFEVRLVRVDEPILRVPQLAIHLDRDIRTEGLKLNPQQHLAPIWSLDSEPIDDDDPNRPFIAALASWLDVDPDRILSHDLMAFDTQPPAFIGSDRDMVASARIDNLLSTFSATRSLASIGEAGADLRRCPVLVLYDHEEIGSESSTGASSSALGSMLERIAASREVSRTSYLAEMAASIIVSADGAHATHPNYVERHDPEHTIAINRGVAVKSNANVRYATDARSAAFVASVANETGQRLQYYSHRNDLPCGSTIGPMVSSRLATTTVDVGVPQLAMHSIREMAGTSDITDLGRFLRGAWRSSVNVVG